jgi:cell division septation protein DedD
VGYDLGNPSRPRALSWLRLPSQQDPINEPVIADGHLFIPGSPVLVIDIRQPESPRLVALLIPGGPALAVYQGLAYVADNYSGIHIYRPDLAWAGDPSKSRPTPPRPTPRALPSPTFDCRPTDRPSATPTPPTPTPTTRPTTTPYAWPTRRPSPTPTATETAAGIATGRAFLPVMVREAR